MYKNFLIFFLLIFLFTCDNPIKNNDDPDAELDCTLDLGGIIDECGDCAGGETGILPNLKKDICGICNGDGLPDGWILEHYDKNGDGNLDTFCGCVEDGSTLLSSENDYCCKYSGRDACGVCGGEGVDSDDDDICDDNDGDDDGDGIEDANDLCQISLTQGWTSTDETDFDSDGCQDEEEDNDDDNDGALDPDDTDDYNVNICSDIDADTCNDCSSGSYDISNDGADFDNDGLCDSGDLDDDNDTIDDGNDLDPFNQMVCQDVDLDTCDDCSITGIAGPDTANDGGDFDGDGLCDNGDDDDDDDGVADTLDDCSQGETGWISDQATTDYDMDGCQDSSEDTDDDNDSIEDSYDSCAKGDLDWVSDGTTDFDSDGCQDEEEDNDDDNDGALDPDDTDDYNVNICSDIDADTCNDCITGIFDLENDDNLGCGCGLGTPSGCDQLCGSTAEVDCLGECNGDAIEDCAGTCEGNAIEDCAGVCNGDSLADNCSTCDNDSSNNCIQDCLDIWGGDAVIDECGTCDSDSSNDCIQDCAGIWGGTTITDECGECQGDGICIDNNGDNLCDDINESGLSSSFYESINNQCYFTEDLNTIQTLYDENGSGIDIDIDDNNEVSRLELLDLGLQQWENHRLTSLDCSSYGLSGNLTDELENLIDLKILNLSDNQLNGEIPEQISVLSDLTHLYLNDNDFTFEIPEDFKLLSNLISLDLSNNRLEGQLHEDILSISSLTSLNISNNIDCDENHLNCSRGFGGDLNQEICNIGIVSIIGNQFCQIPACLSAQDYEGSQYTCNCNDDVFVSSGQDCNHICDGSAYLNVCGICVGGLTGLDDSEAKDICGECYGADSNQDFCEICYGGNISCDQGLLTLATWDLDQKQIFNNTMCEGPLSYIYNNDEICYQETGQCSTYEYVFNDNYSFNLNIYNWDIGSTKEEDPSSEITGEWSLPILSNSPIINGSPLHVEYYINDELIEIDFTSLEFLNSYALCSNDSNIGTENHLSNMCQINSLILTQITESQCIISNFISK